MSERAIATDSMDIVGRGAVRLSRSCLASLTDIIRRDVDATIVPRADTPIGQCDQIALLRALGFQNHEQQLTIELDSIVRIASMAKLLVSVATPNLVEQRLLFGDPAARGAGLLPPVEGNLCFA
ncbi:hypothetical protein [Bradyrhizobium sp. CCBAU 65884]|uniref:hypothetical protein n=1 Tax=Bradyrhizobium sp. CCBAU 65884 TaxID=722477 RepID=UPI00230569CD|nr:hypothetical protein [Bradyrhizobium sp. CCBAU 65884]